MLSAVQISVASVQSSCDVGAEHLRLVVFVMQEHFFIDDCVDVAVRRWRPGGPGYHSRFKRAPTRCARWAGPLVLGAPRVRKKQAGSHG